MRSSESFESLTIKSPSPNSLSRVSQSSACFLARMKTCSSTLTLSLLERMSFDEDTLCRGKWNCLALPKTPRVSATTLPSADSVHFDGLL